MKLTLMRFPEKHGFALPTVLIASVVMLIVLSSAIGGSASIRSALDSQYYNQLAREAAESGLAVASACLQDSDYAPQWSTASPLRPNTPCTGGTACTNNDNCFVMTNGNIRTTFEVGTPTNQVVSQRVKVDGKVELLKTSDGSVWRTFSYSLNARVNADVSFNTVAFGYSVSSGVGGAYFATVTPDGNVQAVGYNGFGQLGNGTSSDTLVPTSFQLPVGEKGAGIYTNFLSQGHDMYIITASGKVYGAGRNQGGQLGDGTTAAFKSTPVQFQLPAGVTGKFVSINGGATFVLGSDNEIYSAGVCDFGLLGYSYTMTGCSSKSTHQLVALPPGVIPTTNIVTDAQSVYVRMQSGAVYAWGWNANGHFGNGGTTDVSAPIKIGSYGDAAQPKAVSVAFDGVSSFIADDTGAVKSAGVNANGQLGAEKIRIAHNGTSLCLTSNVTAVQILACSGAATQEWTFKSDGTIYHPNTNKCITNSSGTTITLAACTGAATQQFVLRDDSMIFNANANNCLSTSGSNVIESACGQKFNLPDNTSFRNYALPASAGKATKVVTDQWFTAVLTDTGEVWSSGINSKGQLGNGKTAVYQPYPVKFILPAGVTASDVYVASKNPAPTGTPQYSNTFVIGSDGKVYGAGANDFGQLGDGTTIDRSTPVAMNVINGSGIKAKEVVTGFGTTVILTQAGRIYTVGNNTNGQLGDGTTTNSSTPKANRYTNILPPAIF